MSPGIDALRAGYVVVFGAAALICFLSIIRARRRLPDDDTRRGLIALLSTSGLWACFIVGRLVAPPPAVKTAFFMLGLVTGLATVGAWLYFCSAYVGRPYHRERRYRWLAVGVYVSIVSVKITNPLHGQYFSTNLAADPFTHLAIELGLLHWIVTGVTYVLAGIGFYLLFDAFRDSGYATTRLSVIVGLAGLPVAFNLLSYVAPDVVIPMNYESVGVAVFSIGILCVADGSFLAVRRFGREQLFDDLSEGIVFLDDSGVVRDANEAARRLFPALADSRGEPIEAVAPEVAAYLPVQQPHLVDLENTGATEYYLLTGSELTAGRTTVGHALTFTDVTEVERQRRKVERQHAQFDDFAEAITHELRNTITIASGHLQTAESRLDPETHAPVRENIDTAAAATDRMTEIVDDLSTLARFGRTVEQTADVEVGTVARRVWSLLASEQQSLTVRTDATVEADPTRLELLLERLLRFSLENGATEIAIDATDAAIVLTDDGEPIEPEQVAGAFAYGEAVPDAGSGMSLPIVRTIAEAHGWSVSVDNGYTDGVRIRIEL